MPCRQRMTICLPQLRAWSTVVLLALLSPAASYGWGEDGHKIVADIAVRDLTPEAKAAVEALLKDDPEDQTLVDASTWADRIRKDHQYDWAKPLHYANVKPGADRLDMARDCPDGNCVVGAITKYANVLRNKDASQADKREALKFLAHFVGDVHQPLHVSHAKDKGGNDIKVEFFNNRTNLHSLWDSGLLRQTKKKWSEYADELAKSIKPEQREQWKGGDPAHTSLTSNV